MSVCMKTKRHVCVVALASALTLALAAPVSAFAADAVPVVPEASIEQTVTAANGEKEVAITGTVKATTVSVTVPTQVAFYIDPGATQGTTKSATENKYGQFTNPTNLTITNHSAVDVYGYVCNVTSPHVTLASSTAGVKKPGGVAPSAGRKADIGVMVGICDTNTASLDFGTSSNWLTESGVGDAKATRYYAFNKNHYGKLAAATDASGTVDDSREDKGSYTMTIRGAVFNGGWSQDENFLVTPKFKIVATDPSTVA